MLRGEAERQTEQLAASTRAVLPRWLLYKKPGNKNAPASASCLACAGTVILNHQPKAFSEDNFHCAKRCVVWLMAGASKQNAGMQTSLSASPAWASTGVEKIIANFIARSTCTANHGPEK